MRRARPSSRSAHLGRAAAWWGRRGPGPQQQRQPSAVPCCKCRQRPRRPARGGAKRGGGEGVSRPQVCGAVRASAYKVERPAALPRCRPCRLGASSTSCGHHEHSQSRVSLLSPMGMHARTSPGRRRRRRTRWGRRSSGGAAGEGRGLAPRVGRFACLCNSRRHSQCRGQRSARGRRRHRLRGHKVERRLRTDGSAPRQRTRVEVPLGRPAAAAARPAPLQRALRAPLCACAARGAALACR